MKFVSYKNKDGEERLGIILKINVNGNPEDSEENLQVIDLAKHAEMMGIQLPSKMAEFLQNWDENFEQAKKVEANFLQSKLVLVEDKGSITPLAPVPHPTSCRDAYAFRQHVATARRNRGVEMIPEFDQYPIFYFTNHNAIMGEGDIPVEEDHLHKLDLELEAAVVIGKRGINVDAKDADSYIAGYMIMNDLSARVLQMEEMKLNLGPAKGKDFSTVIGPWLVTVDELEQYKVKTPSHQVGDKYDLKMTAFHNGKQISEGSMKDMDWTFAEIIERCSYGTEIYPGDVIGSGTVGTGCYLELNGTAALEAKERGEEFTPTWLEDGDTIELRIDGLGVLRNRMVKTNNGVSILAKKKLDNKVTA